MLLWLLVTGGDITPVSGSLDTEFMLLWLLATELLCPLPPLLDDVCHPRLLDVLIKGWK